MSKKMSQQVQKKPQSGAPDTVRETDPNVQQGKASRPDYSVWVTASAGTGKTKVLTDRILRLLLPDADGRPGTNAGKILCLTYTKAGAGEMAIRLSNTLTRWAIAPEDDLRTELKKLQNREPTTKDLDKARQLFAEVADTPGGIKILTIHSFCQSVLGRFPLEASVPPYFRPLQETDAAALLQQARDTILKQAEDDKNSPLASALDRVARAVNEEQFFELIRSIAKERGQLERVMQNGAEDVYKKLCERLSLPPEREPEDMLRDACHSAAFDEPGLRAACKALADHGNKTDNDNAAIIQSWLDFKDRAAGLRDYSLAYLKKDGEIRVKLAGVDVERGAPGTAAILQAEAERLFKLFDRMNAAASALLTRDLLILGGEIVAHYQSLKLAQSALDFDDLIFMTCALLEGRAEWVLYKLDGGIDHILVDEAQDTNPEQWRVVEALAKEFTAGAGASETERTIFVVGDEKQSIYSFQRAAPQEFHRMRGWLREKISDAEKNWDDVPMSISFRSTKSVLQTVDATFASPAMQDGVSESAIEHISHRRGQAGLVELWPIFETPETEDIAPWAPPVEITGFETGAAKLAAHIAKTIRGWLDDANAILPARNRRIRASDVMILFRTRNTLFRQVAKALKDQKIPISGADRMILNEQISVQDLFACAEFALQPMDDLNLACLLKSPLIGMSEEELFELAHPRADKLWPALQTSKHKNIIAYLDTILQNAALGPFDFLTAILQNPCPADERSGLHAMQKRLGRDIMEPLDELMNAALDFESDNPPSLQLFLHRQSRGNAEVKREMDESGDFVRLMTIHGAKGLQAPIVILPDTTRAVRGGNSKAERRLLWPDKTGFETPLWSPRAPEGYEEYDAALDAIELEQDREYRRLLYVAMTRAEDRLYVAGCSSTRQPLPDSWFFAMRAGLESLSDTELLADGTLRLENKQLAGKEPDRTDDKTEKTASAEPPPPWLFTPAEPERPPAPPLRPSKSEEPEQPINSPLQADNIHRFRRGTLTHKLLQFLPAHLKEKREHAAREFLNLYAQDIPEKIRASIADETLKILGHPDFAAVFGRGSLAEIPVTGLLDDDRVVSGQIDRLLVTDNEILIVDYKTNRPPPVRAEDVPVLYRNQMNAYAAVLAKIYPGRTISCALLWTDGPTLMKLPPT
ncbi:MAG: double-strand break repair helicase AddA [Alphaproteobacteria bacterium]|jgi:ATP-dependent helicase/nuclease subunit A|nr:double-strand break repair helicase AddA [Alphaproteobacteria bacterium]